MSYTILVIEKNSVARLIGRDGCRIKSIQKITSSGIIILDGDTADTQKVKIVGSDDARNLASNLIEEAVGKILKSEVYAGPKPPEKRINKRRQRQRPSSSFDEMNTNVEALEKINSNVEILNTITVKNERINYQIMPSIKKDFYVEHREINAMSVKDVKTFRLAQNIIRVEYIEENSKFQAIPKPIKTFAHAFQSYPEIMNVITKQPFRKPSPVQCQAWPIIMTGYDLIAISPKGTGKTLAYILPALINLLRQPTPRKLRTGPSVAIISPTRKLVFEIEQEINKYIFAGIKVMSIYDDNDVKTEINHLKEKKPEIIIATPSRLKDLISVMAIQFDHVSYLVFDEADCMLSMGFGIQIEIILKAIRHDKQTIFTSASWPIGVLQLANYFNTNLLQIQIDSNDFTTLNAVKQKVIVLKENEKRFWLENFIKKNISKNDEVLIFKRTKTNEFYKKLKNKNINCR